MFEPSISNSYMMSSTYYNIKQDKNTCLVQLRGDWKLGLAPDGDSLCAAIPVSIKDLCIVSENLEEWDSSLAIALIQVSRWCETKNINLNIESTPEGLQQLLKLATGVPAFKASAASSSSIFQQFRRVLEENWNSLQNSLIFIGDISIAFKQWMRGNAKTRGQDIAYFVVQCGPNALAIVTLIALLVGMILAYLGSVQLRQLGAQVYVSNLVALGMVREMGALMTAVIMAGRTGASYAAQLGTMQVNDEIDALKTMGISSTEFLVVPRMLALVIVMPLLVIYANVVGMFGGALVATTMDVTLSQYIIQIQRSVDWVDISTGLIKSIFFGLLIAFAGCQAGLNCGRNSDAVGMAATTAVVQAIIYLVVADAAFNILYYKLGI
jgi:phospholipid/cholesterol/gamma-HCH transport system permease protein